VATNWPVRISCFVLLIWASANSLPAQVSSAASAQPIPPQTQDAQPAQQPLPDAPAPQSDPAPLPKPLLAGTPGFETDVSAIHRPLTTEEKYVYSLHQAIDPSAHVVNMFQAALQQAANGQPHYGEGWIAFEKRFAASEADQITASLLSFGLLPSVLHQDPRYFRRGSGSAISRVWYAFNRTFVTRMDNGTSGLNTSQIFGDLISCGISTSYYPSRDRTVGYVSENWGVSLGGNSAYNAFEEFYPDLKHFLFHRRKPSAPPAGN